MSLAHGTRLGRDVAIKVLPAEFASSPDRLRRFEREARTVAALNHPNVLSIHDVGTHEGAPYLVMELLDGETLQHRVAGGPLPLNKAIGVALQIVKGLAAAHEKGIVHCDLKPANVFVTSDGNVKTWTSGSQSWRRRGVSRSRQRRPRLPQRPTPPRYSGQWGTCLPSNFAAARWTIGQISSRSGACGMRCYRGSGRLQAKRSRTPSRRSSARILH